MNAADGFDLIGRSLRSTGASTAVPDPTGIIFVMPCHLRQVRIKIGPHTTNKNGQAGIEIVGREHIDPITDSMFVDTQNHALKCCFTRQLPAPDGDGVVLGDLLSTGEITEIIVVGLQKLPNYRNREDDRQTDGDSDRC